MLRLQQEQKRLECKKKDKKLRKSNFISHLFQRKLMNSVSQYGQVIERQNEIENLTQQIQQKSKQIQSWIQTNQEFDNPDKIDVQKMVTEVKPNLRQILKTNQPLNYEFQGLNRHNLVEDLTEFTRNLSLKTSQRNQVQIPEKIADEVLLEELYSKHVESSLKISRFQEQTQLLDSETKRLLKENVQDEDLKRFIFQHFRIFPFLNKFPIFSG